MKKHFFVIALMFVISVVLSSCGKNAIDGYEWMEGKWESRAAAGNLTRSVIITKNHYQTTPIFPREDETYGPEEELVIETYYNHTLGSDVKSFGDGFYIDEHKHQIYWLYDFDIKMYMTKVE